MSTEEYDEKLIIIKKFYCYLKNILVKKYDNDFEELNTLSDFINIYLNKENLNTEDSEEYKNDEHQTDEHQTDEHQNDEHQNDEHQNDEHQNDEHQNDEHQNDEYYSHEEQDETDTKPDEDISNFTENLIKRSQVVGADILLSAAEFINATTQDLSKINLYNKFRDPIERMKKFLENSNVK
jgi:hypothetical protein